MTWLDDFREDLDRYSAADLPLLSRHGRRSAFLLVAGHAELWAVLQYRLSHAVHGSRLPARAKRPALIALAIPHRFIEAMTGISLPGAAQIGPGLRIAHIGTIVVHERAVIGRGCVLSHGVTIGASEAGVPVIGDHVFIGPNATVAGRAVVGDHVAVSANTLVIRDVPDWGLARGVPAEIKLREPG